jgi:cyclase
MKKKNLKIRIIPVLLFKDGLLVKSKNFKFHQTVGDPFHEFSRYNDWNVDELIYLNISKNKNLYDKAIGNVTSSIASGKKSIPKPKTNILEFINYLSRFSSMPLTYGGGISNLEMAKEILKNGADKVSLNTSAFLDNNLITKCANEFGSQSTIVSIDCKKINKKYKVFINSGKEETNLEVSEWIIKAQNLGAGEFLLNSIDEDGMLNGYDIELCKIGVKSSRVPLVILGGAGNVNHFVDVVKFANPHALAAANIFHFTENSYQNLKKELKFHEVNIR